MELRRLLPLPSVFFSFFSLSTPIFFPQFLSLFLLLLFFEENINVGSYLIPLLLFLLIKKVSVTNPLPFLPVQGVQQMHTSVYGEIKAFTSVPGPVRLKNRKWLAGFLWTLKPTRQCYKELPFRNGL